MKNLPMDILRTFVTITDLGGFTQAGEYLGRSQPAVSLQIKRLEEMLEASLLTRHGQQLNLTTQGEQLYRYAKQILILNDEALNTFTKADMSGPIHFGIPSEFATTLLPKIIGRFAQNYPEIELEVTCDISKNLLSLDNKNRFDLILALHDDPSKLANSAIKVDELVWVTGRHHTAHQQSVVPLIVAPQGCIYRKRGIEVLQSIHQPWRVAYTIPDLTGIQSAIEEGLGVTVLAKSTVPETLQIIKTSQKFPNLGKLGISLVTGDKEPNRVVSRLIEYVKISLS